MQYIIAKKYQGKFGLFFRERWKNCPVQYRKTENAVENRFDYIWQSEKESVTLCLITLL